MPIAVLPFTEAQRPAVERALTTAFATTDLDAITPLTGGLSGAEVFRVRVGGVAYVLRIERSRDGFNDPRRAYACMRIAAGTMVAPRVWYADPDDGVAIL